MRSRRGIPRWYAGLGAATVLGSAATGHAQFVFGHARIEVPGSRMLAHADLDGDGDEDLVLPRQYADCVVVRINEGNGHFSDPIPHPTGERPREVDIVDIEGDGDLDLLVTNLEDLSLLRNDGTGAFEAEERLSLGARPTFSVTGDLDGDGDVDIAIRSWDVHPHNVVLWLSDGAGRYSEQRVSLVDSPDFFLLADVDRDGADEIVSFYPLGVYHFDTGLTTSAPLTAVQAGWPGTAMLAHDLDADGDLDIAIAAARRLYVYRNPGNGAFAAYDLYPLRADASGAVAVDVDGDGDADLGVAMEGNSRRSVGLFRNDGDGTFAAPVIHALGPEEPGLLYAIDLDTDGDQDLATLINGSLAVLVNSGGSFASHREHTVDDDPAAVRTGRLNADARPDIITLSHREQTLSVLLSTGDRDFDLDLYGVVGHPAGVATGDVDADGHNDIAVTYWETNGRFVGIFRNVGDGTFALRESIPVETINLVELADLQDDGDLDIILAGGNTHDSFIGILLNSGAGVFEPPVYYAVDDSPYGMSVARLNDDNELDVVTASVNGDANLGLLLSDGAGSFLPVATIETAFRPRRVVSGDVDGDHDTDLVVSGSLHPDNQTYLLRNDGDGAFAPAEVILNTEWTHFALADIDRDGDLDLTGTDRAEERFLVMPNDGTGSFGVALRYYVRELLDTFALDDLDGDGDLDLVVQHGDNFTYTRYIATLENVLVSGSPCPADLDGDGRVGAADLLLILAQWGPCPPECMADVDGDGRVGYADMLILLRDWGDCDADAG